MAEANKKIEGEYGYTPGYSLVAHRYPTRLGDVYALGSTAYYIATGFLLSGQPANDREEIPSILPAGPLQNLILTTCAPQSQSISAKQFAEQLDAAVAVMPD